jgi:hypothetical protein
VAEFVTSLIDQGTASKFLKQIVRHFTELARQNKLDNEIGNAKHLVGLILNRPEATLSDSGDSDADMFQNTI